MVTKYKSTIATITPLFIWLFSYNILAASHKDTTTNDINIIQKPITFDQKRIALTQQYRLDHYGIKTKSIVIEPQMIVLHWTGTKYFQSTYNYFNHSTLEDGRPEIKNHGKLNVSAHFIVDRDGKIYQLMPSNWMARHTIGLNDVAIGVENVGGVDHREDLTLAQVNANARLISYLQTQYPKIIHIIGHYEYSKFRNTKLWKEKNKNYFTIKKDPGTKFMQRVKRALDSYSQSINKK